MVWKILGSVALVATGYGLRVFIEDEYKNWQKNDENVTSLYPSNKDNENIPKELSDAIKEFEDIKSKVFENSFRNLDEKLSVLKNISKKESFFDEQSIDIFDFEVSENININLNSQELINSFEKFANIFKELDKYIKNSLVKLEDILETSNDYNLCDEKQKEFIDYLLNVFNCVATLDAKQIVDENGSITKEYKDSFLKLEEFIS